MVAEYGRVRAWVIARTLERYLDAMMSMPDDWNKDTLDSDTDRATAFAEELVPGLEPLTYTGMGNYFAYSWR